MITRITTNTGNYVRVTAGPSGGGGLSQSAIQGLIDTSVTGLATESYVQQEIAAIPVTDSTAPYTFASSIQIDLSKPNGQSQRTLAANDAFTPITLTAIDGYSHTLKLDLNGYTPTFSGFTLWDSNAVPDTVAGQVNIVTFFRIAGQYYYNWFASYTGTLSDLTDPTLSSFAIQEAYPSRVYFNSSEVITATTFSGFAITGKTIAGITINAGQTTGHYFTVNSNFAAGASATIAYTTGSNFQDASGNALVSFTSTAITNNIAVPTLTSGIVQNATPNRINLTFSENITITTTGWIVVASGGAATISSVSGTGTSTPYFVLNRNIAEGETLILSYSGTTTTDTAGNQLATITNRSVTNNVAANQAPVASNVLITGNTTLGSILTGSYNYTDNEVDLQGTSTFRWLRNGVDIAGQTAITHTIVLADQGTNITFEVTPVALTGTLTGSAVTSAATSIPANAAPVLTAPTFTGTAQEGQTLTAILGSYSDSDVDAAGTHLKQWYTAPTVGGAKTAISGATNLTYVIVTGDVGKYIYFGSTPVAATGTSPGTEVFSGASAAVIAVLSQILTFQTNKSGTFNPTITVTSGVLHWDFGDGQTADSNTPSITYANNTTKTVTVTLGTVPGISSVTAVNFNAQGLVGTLNISQLTSLISATIINNSSLTSIINPNSTAAVYYDGYSNGITSINFSGMPNLTHYAFNANPFLTSVTLPTSSSVITYFDFNQCNLTGTIDLSPLSGLGTVTIHSNPNLTSIINPNSTRVITTYVAYGCNLSSWAGSGLTNLRSLHLAQNYNLASLTLPTISGVFNFVQLTNCALPVSYINNVLSVFNGWFTANSPTANFAMYMSGGTNAAPTGGNGNTDLVNLQSIFTTAGRILTVTKN